MRRQALLQSVLAAVLGLSAVPVSAGALTIGTLPSVTSQVVNDGPGNQTDPHVSGDLVSYASEVGYSSEFAGVITEIRYHDFATGTDAAIPRSSIDDDSLSDVSGSRVVFTRRTADGENLIYVYDRTTAAVSEVAPEASVTQRRAPAIGGQTVAWQDFSFTGNPLEPEVVAHDLDAGVSTRLTFNAHLERDIAVSPNGNIVGFTQCDTSGASCDVFKAIRSGAGWATTAVTSGSGEEGTADTNGALIAYDSTRAGETDIFYQPLTGGAEQQLALTSLDVNPNVSGSLISFERSAPPAGQRDVYVYDTATDTLYQLTDTPEDESLSDISVSQSGLVRVVYQQLDDGNFNIYARSFTLPSTFSAHVQQPVDGDGTSTFNASRGVVPLKFALSENGSPTCDLPPATLRLTRTGGTSPGPIDESLYTGSPDSGAQFRVADCQYHYNLNPRPLGAGSYLAEILINGAAAGAARFDLK